MNRKRNATLAIAVVLGLLVSGLAFGVPSKIDKTYPQLDWQIGYSGVLGPEVYLPHTMLTDRKGDIYLSARYHILTYDSPFISFYSFPSLIKLDSEGNELWEIKYEDEGTRASVVFVDIDDKCNTYVGLTSRGSYETKIIPYREVGRRPSWFSSNR